jgi:hypothetical protein
MLDSKCPNCHSKSIKIIEKRNACWDRKLVCSNCRANLLVNKAWSTIMKILAYFFFFMGIPYSLMFLGPYLFLPVLVGSTFSLIILLAYIAPLEITQ